MSCDDKNQSALAEVRDQLFLDTADDIRLNVVSANLGMNRPTFGFSDATWRAAVKAIALQPKLVRAALQKALDLCIGPQFARIGTLSEATEITDKQFLVVNPNPFVQTGRIVIDPGLASEETRDFCLRDLVTRQFFLTSGMQFNHAVIPPGANRLRQTVAVGAVALPLINSSLLPTANFPYPVMLDRDSIFEEVVVVTANNTITNTLTCLPTEFRHLGPVNTFLRKDLFLASAVGETLLRFNIDETENFPMTGFVRINHNLLGDEVVEYTSNDRTNNILFLKTPLVFAHAAAQPVELTTPGVTVEVSQVVQYGTHWALQETASREVKVVIPIDVLRLSPLDASWLHGAVPVLFATTTATATAANSKIIELVSVTGLPNEAGMLLVNGLQTVFYTLRITTGDVPAHVATPLLAGVTIIPYAIDRVYIFPAPLGDSGFRIVIDPGGPNQEFATVIQVNSAVNKLTLSAPTTLPHLFNEAINVRNQVILAEEIGTAYGGGTAVALLTVPYPATDLEQGNSRTSLGVVQQNEFPGPYIYDPGNRGPSEISLQLNAIIPPATTIAADQVPSRTNLEVVDASLWPDPTALPIGVRIGFGSGFQEDRTLIDRTLARDIKDRGPTLTVPIAIPTSTVDYGMGFGVVDFPESDGLHPAGYRIVIDPLGANREIVIVAQNDPGTTIFTLLFPTTLPHLAGVPIRLLNDVLTTDSLTKPHAGPTQMPSALGQLVQPLVSELVVNAIPSQFPTTGGIVWLNFGKEIINQRKRITIVGSPTSYTLESTANFPTTGFPYQVTIGDGLANEEKVNVTANNTFTNVLTIAVPGTTNPHTAVNEYVRYESGAPEVVEYDSKDSIGPVFRLLINPPAPLTSKHLVSERVILSTAESVSPPSGAGYGFKLPPDPAQCVSILFDLVRAAGIKVTFITG